MAYKRLGPRTKKGAADTTGNNTGNWTVQFTQADWSVNVPEFECNKITVTGGAPTATFNVVVNGATWDTSVYAPNNSWNAAGDPMVLNPGDEVDFYFSDLASDGFQPVMTMWLRYDPALHQLFGVV